MEKLILEGNKAGNCWCGNYGKYYIEIELNDGVYLASIYKQCKEYCLDIVDAKICKTLDDAKKWVVERASGEGAK